MATQNPETEPEPEPKPYDTAIPEEDLPLVVNIRPGNSMEAGVMAFLDTELANGNVGQVVKYILKNPGDRDSERIVDRVTDEMNSSYSITINGNSVRLRDGIKDLWRSGKSEGMSFRELDIVIARDHQGGLETYLQ